METAKVIKIFQQGMSCELWNSHAFVERMLVLSSGDPLSHQVAPPWILTKEMCEGALSMSDNCV